VACRSVLLLWTRKQAECAQGRVPGRFRIWDAVEEYQEEEPEYEVTYEEEEEEDIVFERT